MKKSIETVPVESLILNYDIYPRHQIDSTNVKELVDAEQAGVELPPIIADRKTRFVVDGFHRITKNKRLKIPAIQVEWRDYPNEAAMIEEAVRFNMHGRQLAAYDKARCIMLAEKYGLSMDRLAGALGLTMPRLEGLRIRKTAIGPDSQVMAIKSTLGSLAGQKLEKSQVQGNTAATGMRPIVYVNQVINCIENKLIDKEDERLMAALEKLQGLLKKLLARQRA